MAMGKTERETIENLIKRLKEPRAGCATPFEGTKNEVLMPGYEGVSRIYIDTWLIGPLECLLSGDTKLARSMSRK